MKTIGGEMAVKAEKSFLYLTDSGRSSLRLILASGFKKKRFLLPDFLCGSILGVFSELGVRYSFYRVNADLSMDMREILSKNFDVLYIINYFGRQKKIVKELTGRDFFIIEDNVFLPVFKKPDAPINWIGFNSFRKISHVADGSMIKSTVKLRDGLILKREAPFSALKYKAKRMKYKYRRCGRYSEKKYLRVFERAEDLLRRQKAIYSISKRSLFGLFDFYNDLTLERTKRRANYTLLEKYLNPISIKISPEFPSFYLLYVDRRDGLRKYLFSKGVYLPVHWPNAGMIENILYDHAISIPVDSRYGKDDMRKIAALVEKFYGKIPTKK